MKDARRETDEAFKEMCEIINVYVMLEGVKEYEEFIRTLNAVITKYAVAAANHHHHKRHGEAAEIPETASGS